MTRKGERQLVQNRHVRLLVERSDANLFLWCTPSEKRVWFAKAGGRPLAVVARELLNGWAGYVPPALPVKEPKPKAPAVKTNPLFCTFSGLPKADCLCDLCVERKNK